MGVKGPKKRLGELLVEKGMISPQQLEVALERQRSTREFLGVILVSKGWVSEEDLLRVLAEQFDMPFTRLAEQEVDWSFAMRFSKPIVLEHHCFPLRMDGREVTVAVGNPLDVWAISELERQAGFRKVRLVLMSTQDILKAIGELRQRMHALVEGRAA